MEQAKKQELQALAVKIRLAALEAIHSLGSGHLGGALSICDVLAVLYGEEMTKILQMLREKIYQDREEVLGGVMDLYRQCFQAAQEDEAREALEIRREKLLRKQETLLELAMESRR